MKFRATIIAMLFTFCACEWGSAQPGAETDVWNRVDALNKAIFVSKDSVALKEILRDDVTYAHSGGNIENKKEMISKAVSNQTTYRDITTNKISIQIIDKKTAIVRHQFNAIQKDKEGVESELHLGVLQVWIKEKKAWHLIARQSVKVK